MAVKHQVVEITIYGRELQPGDVLPPTNFPGSPSGTVIRVQEYSHQSLMAYTLDSPNVPGQISADLFITIKRPIPIAT